MTEKRQKPSVQALLNWYDAHRRVLPWRALSGEMADPYHVWLSEIMLQQTTVVTVKPYFEKFIKKWPTVFDLAKASEDEVLTQWAGLGYYSRGRNLLKAAKIVVDDFNGAFPCEIDGLKSLPGIGDYTASAVRSIAFDKPAAVVDGNVERVLSRVFAIETPLPKSKKEITEFAKKLSPKNRCGDYSQSIMDLGATICTPKKPKCNQCPWHKNCCAFKNGSQEKYPIKLPKKKRPIRYTTAFVCIDNNKIFLQKRPDKGLLAGMMEVPSSQWVEIDQAEQKTKKYDIKHVFTHFELRISVSKGDKKQGDYDNGQWVDVKDLDKYALPTVMKKIITFSIKNSS